MTRFRKTLIGVAAVAALGIGGVAIAGATGGGEDDDAGDGPDVVVTGTKAQRAGAAATQAMGGGSVKSVEESDEGGRAAYEVKVDKAGTIWEIQVATDYTVVGRERDDDQ